MVCRLADGKAPAVAEPPADKDAILIAADTVVVLDKQILGKPADSEAASTMLRQLSGRSHRVVTGFAVHGPQSSRTGWVSTRVLFRQLSGEVIARYVATGEPLDKAGSYGIQSGGAALVLAIEGSYTNVVGLPLVETLAALAEVGGPEL